MCGVARRVAGVVDARAAPAAGRRCQHRAVVIAALQVLAARAPRARRRQRRVQGGLRVRPPGAVLASLTARGARRIAGLVELCRGLQHPGRRCYYRWWWWCWCSPAQGHITFTQPGVTSGGGGARRRGAWLSVEAVAWLIVWVNNRVGATWAPGVTGAPHIPTSPRLRQRRGHGVPRIRSPVAVPAGTPRVRARRQAGIADVSAGLQHPAGQRARIIARPAISRCRTGGTSTKLRSSLVPRPPRGNLAGIRARRP